MPGPSSHCCRLSPASGIRPPHHDRHSLLGCSDKLDDLAERELVPTELLPDAVPEVHRELARQLPALQRPFAVRAWLSGAGAAAIPERYLLLLEPDMLMLRPPGLWARPSAPAAIPDPFMGNRDAVAGALAAMLGVVFRRADLVPAGPAPLQIAVRQLAALADAWTEATLALAADEAARSALAGGRSWDKWAWAAAAAAAGVSHLWHRELAATVPVDKSLGRNDSAPALLHYPYVVRYDLDGREACVGQPPDCRGAWHFAKSDHWLSYPPLPLPPLPRGVVDESAAALVAVLAEEAASGGWPLPCPFAEGAVVRCADTGDIWAIGGEGHAKSRRRHTPRVRAPRQGAATAPPKFCNVPQSHHPLMLMPRPTPPTHSPTLKQASQKRRTCPVPS